MGETKREKERERWREGGRKISKNHKNRRTHQIIIATKTRQTNKQINRPVLPRD